MHHAIKQTVRFHSFFSLNGPAPDQPRVKNSSKNTRPAGDARNPEECHTEPSSADRGATRFQLSRVLPRAKFYSGLDVQFDSIASSPQSCQPGQLVVLKTGVDDPIEVMAEAMARGAAGILTEQILPVPICQCIVPNVQRAMTQIALAIYGRPDQNLVMIGVVGEAGKTTAAAAICQVMRDIPCVVTAHTDNESIDRKMIEADLIEQLRRAADEGAAVAVVELQAEAARRGDYDHVCFDVLVITGRNRAKTEFGPSALRCVIEQVPSSGIIVVGADDSHSLMLARSCSSAAVITYGVDSEADVSVNTHHCVDGELTAVLRHEHRSAILQSTLASGTAGAALAAAAAVGIVTENSLVQVAESLGKIRKLAGRYERIWPTDNLPLPKIILDMAGTPTRAKRSLAIARRSILNESTSDNPSVISIPFSKANAKRVGRTKKASKTGRLWCVLMLDPNDTAEALARYGRLMENATDHWVLSCPADQKSSFLTTSHAVLDGVQECASVRLVADEKAAIAWAIGHADSRDTVVILSSGATEQARQERVEHFRTLVDDFQSSIAVNSAAAHSLKIVS